MTCPNCGAALSAPDDATGATCSYCGQSCVIRGRTRFLQRQRPLPTLPAGMRVVVKPLNTPRLAWLAILPIVGFVAGMVAVVYGAIASHRASRVAYTTTTTTQTTTSSSPVKRPPAWWNNAPPFLRDLNGDGVDDVIGMVRAIGGGDQMHFAAFDGATGDPLWESPSIGSYIEVISGASFLTGNFILRSNSGGVIRAFDVATGASQWSAPVGEQIEVLCASSSAGAVDVQTRDDAVRRLTLATGELSGATPLPRGRKRQDCGKAAAIASATPASKEARRLPGLSRGSVFRHGDVAIVAAHKSTGSSVPMIARLGPDGASIAWQAQVPAQHPLTSRFREELTAMTGDLVFAMYEAHELPAPHLTALSLADGARRWDVELPDVDLANGRMYGVAVNQRAVLVSAYDRLLALELGTGKLLFTIGAR